MTFLSLPPHVKTRLAPVAAVLSPVLIVLFTKLFALGPHHVQGSTDTGASRSSTDVTALGISRNVAAELQCEVTQNAFQAATALHSEPYPANPFYLSGMMAGEPDSIPGIPQDIQSPFSISGFIDGARPMAIINAMPCTVGQEIVNGGVRWTVKEINCGKRTVTLTDSNGKSIVASAAQNGVPSHGG